MDSVDGFDFVKNLATFVRTHERALANALQLKRVRPRTTAHNGSSSSAAAGADASSTSAGPSSSSSVTAITLAEALSRPYLRFTSYTIKATRLPLTPHHVHYLLHQFEELGVDIGPMNVRLENLQSNVDPVYTSFLNAPKSKGRSVDNESMKSVSSVRSVMTSMWSAFTLSSAEAKAERRAVQQREDIRYLYSAFTKLPALCLAPDRKAKMVSGYEQFPFDTAVPLFVFKNLSSLEICDLDFRQFYGWDRLAEQLTQLTLRRACIEDPLDLLLSIVLDDMDGRRRRSAQIPAPNTPSTPGAPFPSGGSPKARHVDVVRPMSVPSSPQLEQRRLSATTPLYNSVPRGDPSESTKDGQNAAAPTCKTVQRSTSPTRPVVPRHPSGVKHRRANTQTIRRSSGSSGSSVHETTPRQSSTDLLSMGILPSSKWRFLRHLSLAENALTYLTSASLAPVADTLQSLDLSGNLFCQVPDALSTLTNLRHLNLSNCMINSLSSLTRYPLPAVAVLSLRSNKLTSLVGIERLFSLERVDLRDNRLHDPTELARLTGIPDMRELHVLKNPFCRTHSGYRVSIFNQFRRTPGRIEDVIIDTQPATSGEKKQLVDFAPEQAFVPVVRPPLDDETPPNESVDPFGQSHGMATAEKVKDGHTAANVSLPSNHVRSISDFGPRASIRKKKAARRRIVDLSKADETAPATTAAAPAVKSPRPSIVEFSSPPRLPSMDGPDPQESSTPYHTAPTTQIRRNSSLRAAPPLVNDTPSSSPTRTSRRHLTVSSQHDDEDEDETITPPPPELLKPLAGRESDLYRAKIEALRTDLGQTWLSALSDDHHQHHYHARPRFDEPSPPSHRNRSFSPPSRTSQQIHHSPVSRGVSVGGRALG